MKRILMLLLLCSSFFSATAVFVSGIISTNTTWTKANSPYIVNGNLTVDSAVTLTIEPGVEVRVDSTYIFQVDGKLLAVGTSTDFISFTANAANPSLHPWEGITFTLKSVDTSKIQYCLFTYSDVSIYTTGAKLRISDATFKHNNIAIHINSGPLNNNSNYTYINKCLITENDTGIHVIGNKPINGDVNDNEISFNNIGMMQDNSYDMIWTFRYNTFNYNIIGYSTTGGRHECIRNTFKGNTVYGVCATPVAPGYVGYFSDNIFMYNATALYIDNAVQGTIHFNTIAYNGIGIDDNFSYPGSVSNFFFSMDNNCYFNNTFYNFKENGRFDRYTRDDWWGTTNTSSIDSSIYDFYDDSTNGKLNYTSINTSSSYYCQAVSPPPPCLNPGSLNVVATSPTTVTATWATASGAAGYEYYIVPLSSNPPSMGVVTTASSVNLTSLTGGEKYIFCVRTKCQSSPFLSAWVCDTVTMPCGAPGYVIFNNISTNSAIVWWGATTGATSYEYYVAPHPSTPPVTASTTSNNVAIVTGLSPNTTYDVCVRGKCGSYYSAWKCDTLRTTTGINNLDIQDAVSVYPNPNNGTFTVSLNKLLSDNVAITLYDVTGRMIMSKQIHADNEIISIDNAAKGVYLLRVVTGDAVMNKRIVVE